MITTQLAKQNTTHARGEWTRRPIQHLAIRPRRQSDDASLVRVQKDPSSSAPESNLRPSGAKRGGTIQFYHRRSYYTKVLYPQAENMVGPLRIEAIWLVYRPLTTLRAPRPWGKILRPVPAIATHAVLCPCKQHEYAWADQRLILPLRLIPCCQIFAWAIGNGKPCVRNLVVFDFSDHELWKFSGLYPVHRTILRNLDERLTISRLHFNPFAVVHCPDKYTGPVSAIQVPSILLKAIPNPSRRHQSKNPGTSYRSSTKWSKQYTLLPIIAANTMWRSISISNDTTSRHEARRMLNDRTIK